MNLKKILSKIVIISLTIAIVLIPKVSTIIAIEPEVYIDSQGNIIERVYKDEESFRLIGTHAFSEYTKKTADMGVEDLDKNPKYTKARGEIKYTRFWNGYSYSCPWQPFRAPRHICYVK